MFHVKHRRREDRRRRATRGPAARVLNGTSSRTQVRLPGTPERRASVEVRPNGRAHPEAAGTQGEHRARPVPERRARVAVGAGWRLVAPPQRRVADAVGGRPPPERAAAVARWSGHTTRSRWMPKWSASGGLKVRTGAESRSRGADVAPGTGGRWLSAEPKARSRARAWKDRKVEPRRERPESTRRATGRVTKARSSRSVGVAKAQAGHRRSRLGTRVDVVGYSRRAPGTPPVGLYIGAPRQGEDCRARSNGRPAVQGAALGVCVPTPRKLISRSAAT
jgi:hypothetical protein